MNYKKQFDAGADRFWIAHLYWEYGSEERGGDVALILY